MGQRAAELCAGSGGVEGTGVLRTLSSPSLQAVPKGPQGALREPKALLQTTDHNHLNKPSDKMSPMLQVAFAQQAKHP